MPTTYPVTLPPVPDDPETTWHAQRVSDTVFERPDEGWPSATTLFATDVSSPAEAELRVLAWINHSHEDDLRQATATAEHQAARPLARQPPCSRRVLSRTEAHPTERREAPP